jgi:hypothetical protein
MACSARLLNEAASQLTLFADNLPLSTAGASSTASYAPYNCTAALTVSGGVAVSGDTNAPRLSVLAMEHTVGAVVAKALIDAAAPFDDDELGHNIDLAELRFVNAGSSPLYLFGVPAECHGCALPAQLNGRMIPGGGGAASINVSTKYPFAY